MTSSKNLLREGSFVVASTNADSPPPKSIWNPSKFEGFSDDELEGTYDTMSLTSASSMRTPHTSAQMNAVKLRVQLWDSYRLARIILGIPIKSFNLESKTILNAIRVVAEMKVELIRLGDRVKELEVEDGTKENVQSGQSVAEGGVKNSAETKEECRREIERQHQERNEKFESLQQQLSEMLETAKQSVEATTEEVNNTQTDGQEDLQELLKTLLQKVDNISQESKSKLSLLQETLESSQQQSLEHAQQLQEVQRKFQTKKTIHQIELESMRSKHMQQIMDMAGQLETYQEQVDRQHADILGWQDRYHELENMAVTPDQAHNVLHAINGITEDSPLDEQMAVQGQVVQILEKMAQMYSKQIYDQRGLHATVEAAKRKEAKSKEELEDLKIQEEILAEDAKVPAEDWREALVAQKLFCERQIDDIMVREENRQLEMEILELRLTEMAFAAIEIEDLQKEIKQNQKSHSLKVKKVNTSAESSAQSISKIQKQVENIIKEQNQSIKVLGKSKAAKKNKKWKALLERKTAIERMTELEKELAVRNEELCQTRDELSKSQAQIQLLQHQLKLAQASKASTNKGKENQGPPGENKGKVNKAQ